MTNINLQDINLQDISEGAYLQNNRQFMSESLINELESVEKENRAATALESLKNAQISLDKLGDNLHGFVSPHLHIAAMRLDNT